MTMCLGIPGQIVEMNMGHEHLARVDVNGVCRTINVGLLEDEDMRAGDWVLIHVGFAMSKIDEHEARQALASLKMMGEIFSEEVEALMSSPATSVVGPPQRGE
jgi:hydrogenase expression/formation protein HypC